MFLQHSANTLIHLRVPWEQSEHFELQFPIILIQSYMDAPDRRVQAVL